MKRNRQSRDESASGRPLRIALLAGGAILCAIVGWNLGGHVSHPGRDAAPRDHPRPRAEHPQRATAARTTAASKSQQAAPSPKNAESGEAVLRFASDDAMRRFLANPPAGIRILGSEPRLRALRVGFSDPKALDALRSAGDIGVEYNFVVSVPEIPDPEKIASLGSGAPFGGGALAWLGASGRSPTWGAGVKVAVLDSGIQAHASLKGVSIRSIDLVGGASSGSYSGHATAVASLLAGAGDIMGVAPGVEIFDLRVLDASGTGDSFTLASAILRAADMGAQIISLSLGTYGDSGLVRDAINYALGRNIAIVAAAGNDGFSNLTYPARYPGVIAVGSIDATGIAAPFSNTGKTLGIVAPGTSITAAWLNDGSINFSGTSASVPFVSGAIAYILAEQRYLSATAAASLVLQNANDAGPPGNDPSYGGGMLDLGRLSERQTPGIHDLAIASHWVAPSDTAAGDSVPVLVTVQNRGTVAASYAVLDVTDGRSSDRFTIPNLAPGAISTHIFHLRTATSEGGAEAFVRSSVTQKGATDVRPTNNYRVSVLVPSP